MNPKIVLLEGVNKSGKTYLTNQFRKKYKDKIRIIKFPHDRTNINQIIFLYKEIQKMVVAHPNQITRYLGIIHQIFDLDFRQFEAAQKSIIESLRPDITIFLDRYYPSNLVYAIMHGIKPNPMWDLGHYFKPDITIQLTITGEEDRKKYMKEFPVFDNTVTVEYDTGVSNEIQLLTPHQLLFDGQAFYADILREEVAKGKIGKYERVTALREETFALTEKILIENGFLTG